MPGRSLSASALAREAGLHVDEVLLTLWDEGFSYIRSQDSPVRNRDLKCARRSLGLATRRDLKSSDYWRNLLALGQSEFAALLHTLGITPARSGTGLPKKAVTRLKAEARRRGRDPLTGRALAQLPATASAHATTRHPSPVPSLSQSLQEPEASPTRSFTFEPPGQPLSPDFVHLSADYVERIHFALVRDFAQAADPINPAGLRSQDTLESACFRPHTSLSGTLKYRTKEAAIAALFHSLVQNHPFHNGNKRTALVSLLASLEGNGLFPESTCTQDSLFKLVLQVAQHRIAGKQRRDRDDREVQAIAKWLCDHFRPIEKQEYVLPWRKLERILRRFDCELPTPRPGNRRDIHRTVELPTTTSILGRQRRAKKKQLFTQVAYTDGGRDVGIEVVKRIRQDLHLDTEHDVDSRLFYTKASSETDGFVTEYWRVLRRLAKL